MFQVVLTFSEDLGAFYLGEVCARVSYQVIEISYTAWLFPQSPPENLMQTVKESPELSRRTAIYDLSRAYGDKPLCLKLNETDRIVFKEFEMFLEQELGVEVKLVHKLARMTVAR